MCRIPFGSGYCPLAIWGIPPSNYRVNIWIGTMKMLKDFWFCGVGPGEDAFNTVYPLSQPQRH